MKPDRYRSFEELGEHEREGFDYQIRSHDRPSAVAVIARHGGKIEAGTSEIAEAIAGEHFSFYAFEGIKRGHNHDLRLASSRFDEPECLRVMAKARLVLAVDGLQDASAEYAEIGGADERLKRALVAALKEAGFDAREPGGAHADQLSNRGGPGVELGISRALRERLKEGTTDLDEFAGTVRAVLFARAAPAAPGG